MRMGVNRSSKAKMGRQARPKEKATGTLRMIRKMKVPNMVAATSPGDIVIPPQMGNRFFVGQEDNSEGPEDALSQKQEPADPGQQVDSMNEDHVDPRQLGSLVVSEERVGISVGDKDHREDEHEGIYDKPHDCFAFGASRGWDDIHLEVRSLRAGDRGPEENDPDETETGGLFGPDVSRDKAGIAREDL